MFGFDFLVERDKEISQPVLRLLEVNSGPAMEGECRPVRVTAAQKCCVGARNLWRGGGLKWCDCVVTIITITAKEICRKLVDDTLRVSLCFVIL